ncbi:sensor histidine kinase [Marinilabilia rubra]|uniref:Histidine kinase n=1 Tax=Marinilabilia rubra TaxID=2162893 RepID=A0A2U2BBN0_9BACT|nr:sensor histidine kinase [Marinilabilia rubra]PWE00468.1 histidine kinase [Marinilabilia rubra]
MNREKHRINLRRAWAVVSSEFKKLGWLHIILWVGYSFVFFYGPNLIFDTETAILITLRTLAINALIFYVNILVLLPLLMGRNRVKTYIFSLVVLLAVVAVFHQVTDPVKPEIWVQLRERREDTRVNNPLLRENSSVPERRHTRPLTPSGRSKSVKQILPRHFLAGLLPPLGMLFLSTLFWIVLESKRKEKEQLSLTNQSLETEMKFLKSQMNPHFLFNALNNIYSLSQQGSSKTSQLILKLSSMLRFIVYETDEMKILIGCEVDYIRDYVEFQKIKLEEKPNLDIDFSAIDREIRIEPMLIFPFVENAFKHGSIDDTKTGWIKMGLKALDGHILFFSQNSKPSRYVSKDRSKGIGIENVKKRLSYLYKGRYRLDVIDRKDVFEVQLEIDTI